MEPNVWMALVLAYAGGMASMWLVLLLAMRAPIEPLCAHGNRKHACGLCAYNVLHNNLRR